MGKKWGRANNSPIDWPNKENGEPESPVFLCLESGLNMEGDMTANMLGAYGIPVIKQYPLDGSFGRVVLGVPASGTELYVPESMLETALGLINSEVEISEDEVGILPEDDED